MTSDSRRSAPASRNRAGTIRTTRIAAAAVVALHGEHDLATAPKVDAALKAASRGRPSVIVEVSNCLFIDSSVIRVILDANKRAADDRQSFALVAPPSTPHAIRRILEITALDRVVAIHPTLDAAIAAASRISL